LPILFSVLGFGAFFLYSLDGKETFRQLGDAAVFSVFLFAGTYFLQFLFGQRFILYLDMMGDFSDENVVLCNRCFSAKQRDVSTKCDCGGTFESILDWEWRADVHKKSDAKQCAAADLPAGRQAFAAKVAVQLEGRCCGKRR
jgi:hypothetical protein